MALGYVGALLNGLLKNVIVAMDGSGNLAPGHMLVDPSLVPLGTTANPLVVGAGAAGARLSVSTIGATASYAALAASASVGTTSSPVIAAGAYTNLLVLQAAPATTGTVWLNLAGGAAVVGQGMCIPAGGCIIFGNGSLPIPTAAINGISDSGTVGVSIQGA